MMGFTGVYCGKHGQWSISAYKFMYSITHIMTILTVNLEHHCVQLGLIQTVVW